MRKTVLRIGLLLSALILVAFVVFLVNQTAQIVALASQLHPVMGEVVFWALLLFYAICLLVPVVLYFRLPKALVPPESEESPHFEAHLAALRKRLDANPSLEGMSLSSRLEIERALGVLDAEADGLIRGAGAQVFITTAISQNGSLDAFIVLAAQSRLVWQIAHAYYQRPTLRDLVRLYANVASTAFIASELEDVDVAAQLEPVMASAVGSVVGAVPGFQAASSFVVNSVATGAANAFLTLRVGIIAKNYSNALVLPKKGTLRRSAMASATKMLGVVAAEGTKKVSGALWRASKAKVGGVVSGVGDAVGDVVGGAGDMVGGVVGGASDLVKDSGSWVTEKIRRTIKREEASEEG